MMIAQAGPMKLQINSCFNQQLKCILRVNWDDYSNITPDFSISKNKTRSTSKEETYYLLVPYPFALIKAETPTIKAGTP